MKKKFTINIYLNDTQISLLTKYDWENGVMYADLEYEEDYETLRELEDLEIIGYKDEFSTERILTLHGRKIFGQLNK